LPGLLLTLTAEPVLWKFQGQHWYLLLMLPHVCLFEEEITTIKSEAFVICRALNPSKNKTTPLNLSGKCTRYTFREWCWTSTTFRISL
jgi:hypothetical protein